MIIPATKNFTLWKGSTFGPVRFIAYSDKEHTIIKDLTGWLAHAKVRERANGPVVRDLLPTITNGPGGEITIPAITDEITRTPSIPRGDYVWDMMLENPGGAILGPFFEGTFLIKLSVSRDS